MEIKTIHTSKLDAFIDAEVIKVMGERYPTLSAAERQSLIDTFTDEVDEIRNDVEEWVVSTNMIHDKEAGTMYISKSELTTKLNFNNRLDAIAMLKLGSCERFDHGSYIQWVKA
ncbi:HMG-box domain-containing protein [Deinococcus ficus]|uniref:hypothetical protein n=1 Tax=Deinococcus ficus TaxID=317577 RepID=UPI00131C3E29|nr:hypothetical protein [Deinococcus ficus]